jgi:hypothetical protein
MGVIAPVRGSGCADRHLRPRRTELTFLLALRSPSTAIFPPSQTALHFPNHTQVRAQQTRITTLDSS